MNITMTMIMKMTMIMMKMKMKMKMIHIGCFCNMENRMSQSCSRIINFLLVFTKRYLL